MIVAGSVSEVLGRKRVMVFSLAASSLATTLAALAPDWPTLLALRALAGLALAGLPAVAMAYLSDEMDAEAIGLAMGLYIAGGSLGGMAGRLVVAALSDQFGWRPAIGATGAVRLAGAALIAFALPISLRFSPRRPDFGGLAASLTRHFSDPGLRLLFAEAFLLMGSFVCSYNYIGFRLTAPPFSLSQTKIGFIFVLYLLGAVSSMTMGDLAGRFGRRRVLWIAIAIQLAGVATTLPDNIVAIVVGVGLITWGFFGAHSIASSWIGLRAHGARAQAAALYLFFYYLGFEPGGLGGRVVLRALRLARRRGPPRGADGNRAGCRAAPFQSPAAAPSCQELSRSGAMEWRDEGIVIGVKRHGESSAIVEAMTRGHGRHLGLVRSGRSPRLQAPLQPGNTLGLVWRARLDEHLGVYAIEPLALRAGRLIASALALSGIGYLGALMRLLPERDPHEPLFEALALIADHLDDAGIAPALIARFEAQVLAECGFSLDSSSAARRPARART